MLFFKAIALLTLSFLAVASPGGEPSKTTTPAKTSKTTTPVKTSTTTTPVKTSKTTTPVKTSTTTTPVKTSKTTTPVKTSTTTTPSKPTTTSTSPLPTKTLSPTTTVTVTETATPTSEPASQCDTGNIQCCDSTEEASSASGQQLLGLLGIVLDDLNVLLGVTCSPISVIGIGGNSCTAAPVCCENNNFNGLISIGCVPIILGL
ncbi:fungal hydrophobin-domain-containing protein [Phellopilus nigrolimitatus]|nr:fungal hydrophobin-domain-containing protein [Phellopilus nigrolimitatus]